MDIIDTGGISGLKIPRRKLLEWLFAGLAMCTISGCDNNIIKPMESTEFVRPGMSVGSSIVPNSTTMRLRNLQAIVLLHHPIWSLLSIQNTWTLQLNRWDGNSYILEFEWSGKYTGLHFRYTDSGIFTNLWVENLNILELPGLLGILESVL